MSAIQEAPRFESRPSQPGLDPMINLMNSLARRDALIDRVVSFGSMRPQATVTETPVLPDSSVMDVTRSKRNPAKKRRLTGLGKLVAGGTAIVAGLTAAGATPKTTEAAGFLTEGGSVNTTVECIEDVILVYKTPPVIAVAGGADVPTTDQTTNEAAAAENPNGGDAPTESLAPAGDGTAVIESITPDEAFANLFKLADNCPPKENPSEAMNVATEITSQAEENINAPSESKITNKKNTGKFDKLWGKYKEDFGSYPLPEKPNKLMTKEYVGAYLKQLFDRSRGGMRSLDAAGAIANLLYLYLKTENIDAKKAIEELGDMIYDYTVKNVLDREHLNQERESLNGLVIGFLTSYLYPDQA